MIVQAIDRWIYVIMAAWFILTVLAGFVPDSIGKVMAVRLGFMPPFPAILHIHAVLMGSWLLLLLTQTILMARGKRAYHMQLGVAAVALVPAMVGAGFILVPTMFLRNWAAMQGAPPEVLPGGSVESGHNLISSLVAAQIMAGILFPTFVAWALLVRRTNPGMHKRLMILATVLPIPAAIDRIAWLPSSYPESALSPLLYTVIWIMPMFLWDLFRLKRIHKAYVVWFSIYIPAAIAVYSLWWTPGWIAAVHRMMGVA
jgi:hypothetical protein